MVDALCTPEKALLFSWHKREPEPEVPAALKTEKEQPGVVTHRDAQLETVVTEEELAIWVPATSCPE